MKNSVQFSIETKRARNATVITLVLMIATLPTAALFIYFGYINSLPQLYIPAITLLATPIFDIYPLSLIRRGRTDYAMMLVTTAFIVNVLIVPFVLQGLGIIIALSIVLVLLSTSLLTMSPRFATPGLIVAVVAGAVAIILDVSLGGWRVNVPELERYTPIILGAIAIPVVFVFLGEFKRFSLQTKVTLGILLTGGVTVATLVIFGANRFNIFGDFLASKFEANVTEKNEAEILNTINSEAGSIDNTFREIQADLVILTEYLADLSQNKAVFGSGNYWNASEQIVQLPGGQFGNSRNDKVSVFIPNNHPLTDVMIADLNATIHFDLVTPKILEAHSGVAAVYYISDLGYTIYYPNIGLANNVPADFDPTQEPFYTIADPSNNPERLPRLTQPYSDPAGAGLIVTLAVPVYNGDIFEGVVGADIQLSKVIESVSQLRLGSAGIPLLVDNTGVILSMSEAGYTFFGLQPEVVAFNDQPRQTIFDSPDPELQDVAQQIYNSQTGISRFEINNIETYVSVSILGSTGYKLVFIVPVSDVNSEVAALRREVDNEFIQTIQETTLILTALFFGAFIVSLVVGQIITRPLKRLTETAEQIAGGNLSSRASIETEDESGTLARAFNTMANELTGTLQGLENRIAQRTQELELLNQSNAYRASLFESIARISRIISSTRSMEQLLPQITETISNQLGYYHVGIFLVDAHKEYAVLVAANSEGGKVMLDRNHRLRVGETGLVGFVTKSGTPRVALDVGLDAVFFNNPDLPETHSEIALPLRSGNEIIGALDVQSTTINAFSEEDVNILSTLADQVSIAIQNARSFQQSLDALEQAERTAAQLSAQQWSHYQQQQGTAGYHFDGIDVQRGKPKRKELPNTVTIPIILRGVQIGNLKLSAPDPNRKWDENEVAMAQATAERTALAIETARLLQDAQKRAAKERTIGQISSKIGSLVNIDNIVQTTIQELGESLSGTEVAIQFTSGQSRQNT